MAHPQMFDDDDPMLERVRAIALSLPEAAEKISHGRPAFFTKKIFAHYGGTEKLASGEMVQHPQALLALLDPMDAEVVLERADSFVPDVPRSFRLGRSRNRRPRRRGDPRTACRFLSEHRLGDVDQGP